MERALRGLTLPNHQWEPYPQEELDAILDLNPDCLLILCYDNPSQADRIVQEVHLWRDLGQPPVILRPYAENIITFEPVEWAVVCARLVTMYKTVGMEIAGLIPGNEFNIEGLENDDWVHMVNWENAFGEEWRFTGVPLHRPALAPVRNYLEGYSQRMLTGSKRFAVEDVHVYTEAQLNDVGYLHELFPDKPIFVSEVNQMAPSVYIPRLVAMPFASGASWFIAKWIDPEPGAPNVDLIGGPYYQDFKESRGIPLPGPVEATEPHPGDDEGGTMPEFQVGQGIMEAMAKHGEDPVEDEHYLWPDLYSICASTEALYIYSFKANTIFRCPKA